MNRTDDGTIGVSEAATLLGEGVTAENVRARIRRGTLPATRSSDGAWQIRLADVARLVDALDLCECGTGPASHLVIVKYPYHERLEFVLCARCAANAVESYSLDGNVLEVGGWALLGEGWKKP